MSNMNLSSVEVPVTGHPETAVSRTQNSLKCSTKVSGDWSRRLNESG